MGGPPARIAELEVLAVLRPPLRPRRVNTTRRRRRSTRSRRVYTAAGTIAAPEVPRRGSPTSPLDQSASLTAAAGSEVVATV